MTTPFSAILPDYRLERALADKKPLLPLAEALAEADRCLYCSDAPCIKACPTEIDIPTFIKKIASGNVRGAARTILDQNMLGYSCARVCPTEVLCEGACVYTGWQKAPIKIGRLQRYATEHATTLTPRAGALAPQGRVEPPLFTPKPPTGRRVACVGAGPASLAFAAYAALDGHRAVVFEKRALPGGLNTTGIAPYKLHAHDAVHEVEWIARLGVEITTGVDVGTTMSAADLLRDYDAVFLGLGLGEDTVLGIPGESGHGVHGATEWIEKMKLAEASSGAPPWKHVVIVGGGNTAIDAARETAQLGAGEVTLLYRRGLEHMSAYRHETTGARTEGVRVRAHTQPVAFLRDAAGVLTGVRVAHTGADGKPIAGTEQDLPCDLALLAIGQSKLRDVARAFPGVELDARGCIKADPRTGQTGNPKVFSGGDCVNGGKEVVNAVADGRNAARSFSARAAEKK